MLPIAFPRYFTDPEQNFLELSLTLYIRLHSYIPINGGLLNRNQLWLNLPKIKGFVERSG